MVLRLNDARRLLQPQAHGLRQFRLAIIESPEALGLESERGGNVERIEGACTENRRVGPGEINGDGEGQFRLCHFVPDPGTEILFQLTMDLPRLRGGDPSAEDVLFYGMRELCQVQWRPKRPLAPRE